MADSLNKVMLIGNVGNDPEIVEFQSGILASFSLATSHSWVDNKTKERKTNTDWHRIVVYGDGLVGIIKKINIRKGTKLFIEGKLVTRKWTDKEGNNRSTVEVVLQGYNCSLIVLTPNNNGSSRGGFEDNNDGASSGGGNNYRVVNDSKKDFGSSVKEDDFDGFLEDGFDLGEEDKLMF